MKTIMTITTVLTLAAGASFAGEDGGPGRDGFRTNNGPLFGGCASNCIASYEKDQGADYDHAANAYDRPGNADYALTGKREN